MTRNRLRLLAAIAAVALPAGCGGASTTADTSTEAAAAVRSDRGMIEFARCMRAHGINMPDPFHRPGHEGLSIELPQQGPATTDGYKACGQFLQPAIELKQQAAAQTITPAIRLGLIHYAECMRSHAVPMLDPNATGQLNLGNVPEISDGFGRYTPQFHAADHDCRHLLPATIPDNGTGP
jgi:hypothetical protein